VAAAAAALSGWSASDSSGIWLAAITRKRRRCTACRAVTAAKLPAGSCVMRSSVSNRILLPMLCETTTSGMSARAPDSTCSTASRMRSCMVSRATPW
jgi:hypothetical protein